MKQYFCLGSYTEPILFGTGELFIGKGKGISIYEFENGNGKLINEIFTTNPSFFCVHKAKKKIFAVNETKTYLGQLGGGITEITYDACFNLALSASWNTGGKDPCHVEIAPNLGFLVVSNFHSGSISLFPLDKQGNISEDQPQVFNHEGSSVHPIRQKEPHAHSCIFVPGSKIFYIPDLGIDQIVAYEYSGKTAKPFPPRTIQIPKGSGPRFGEFSKNGKHFYLINELSSEIMHFANIGDRLILQDRKSTLPPDYAGENICSDLHITPDETKLYASNRGHDSIACFNIENDGKLEYANRTPCGGRTPRNFAIDPLGNYVLVGNQDSDHIAVFRISPNGALSLQNRIKTGSPVCIRFIA